MFATQLEALLSVVGPHLQKQDFIREAITPAERLALTLRYLTSGDSMTSMTFQYLMGKTTVCNIVRETCSVIWNVLHPMVLPPILTKEKWIEITRDFKELRNFIHCIGAIDGKHVIIQKIALHIAHRGTSPHSPNNAGSSYYNYKGAYSVVLLAICDAQYIFRYVDIGAYGRQSDGGIFQASTIGQKFDSDHMNVPKPAAIEGGRILPYCLVGDEAFPLKSYLLRPYPGKNGLTPEQAVYNYRLSRTRRMIENTFGILASQWRIYRKPIIANPKNVMLMIQATVCLHNWLRKCDADNATYLNAGLVDEDDPNSSNGFRDGSWRRIFENGCAFTDITRSGSNMSARRCMTIRDKFCDYFNNEGAVSWQENRF
ncbi:PREDICTED: uncharacterized protein LOC108774640 [Cyphomyrmex costatus]|uniref:uncharacterized protein LOC108774640 n=1 Tax=Cyphomyrmex costatus TaxID=456900 RepID=UPI0008523077|nr:PREDICTED: uncharacterized protein LOC108774640 [Cyphomyrmex costatus]